MNRWLFLAPLLAAAQSHQVVPSWPTFTKELPRMEQVTGVAVDAKNRVYVAHRHKKMPIVVFDGATGKFLSSFGADFLPNPHGLSVDPQGNLWIPDIETHQVSKVSPEGKVLMTLGERGKPGNDATHFDRPTQAAVAPNGDIYISDGYGNFRVAQFNAQGKFIRAWGKKGSGPSEFEIPHAVAIDRKGHLYISDRGNSRVQIFDAQGKYLREWKNPGALGRPWALSFAADGTIFLVDGGDAAHGGATRSRVIHLDAAGKVLGEFGRAGFQPGEFDWAHDIAVGPDGAVYVGDVHDGKRIQKFIARK